MLEHPVWIMSKYKHKFVLIFITMNMQMLMTATIIKIHFTSFYIYSDSNYGFALNILSILKMYLWLVLLMVIEFTLFHCNTYCDVVVLYVDDFLY